MTTQTLTLADFLLARLDDSARQAHTFHLASCTGSASMYPPPGQPVAPICGCGLPAWILADVAAKRQIVAWCSEAKRIMVRLPYPNMRESDFVPGGPVHPTDSVVLRMLGTIYADHPDYRDEWRQT